MRLFDFDLFLIFSLHLRSLVEVGTCMGAQLCVSFSESIISGAIHMFMSLYLFMVQMQ